MLKMKEEYGEYTWKSVERKDNSWKGLLNYDPNNRIKTVEISKNILGRSKSEERDQNNEKQGILKTQI